MPNGWSGHFVIDTADLKQLVQAIPPDAVVGKLTVASGLQPARAIEIAQCLNDCRRNRLTVEEQDHAFYVIHIRDEPIIWVAVFSDSPMFVELQRRHAQWRSEHPR
jgi:hypothetical protein